MPGPGGGEELLGLRIVYDSEGAIAGVERLADVTDAAAGRVEGSARRMVSALGQVEPQAQRGGMLFDAYGQRVRSAAEITNQLGPAAARASVGLNNLGEGARNAGNLSERLGLRALLLEMTALPGPAGQAAGVLARVGGSLATLGVVGGAIGATVVALQTLKSAVVEAAASEDSIQRLNFALASVGVGAREMNIALEESFQAVQKITRLSDEEARDTFTSLLNIVGDSRRAWDLYALSLNIAAARGIPLNTVTRLLATGLETGQFMGRRMGLVLDENAKKMFEHGTETQRAAILMEQFSRFEGAAIAQGETATGVWTRLGHSISENVLEPLGRTVGTDPLQYWTRSLGLLQVRAEELNRLKLNPFPIDPAAAARIDLFREKLATVNAALLNTTGYDAFAKKAAEVQRLFAASQTETGMGMREALRANELGLNDQALAMAAAVQDEKSYQLLLADRTRLLKGIAQANEAVAAAEAKRAKEEAAAVAAKNYEDLKLKIDDAAAATKKFRDAFHALGAALSSGHIDREQYLRDKDAINRTYDEEMEKVRQNSAAMREARDVGLVPYSEQVRVLNERIGYLTRHLRDAGEAGLWAAEQLRKTREELRQLEEGAARAPLKAVGIKFTDEERRPILDARATLLSLGDAAPVVGGANVVLSELDARLRALSADAVALKDLNLADPVAALENYRRKLAEINELSSPKPIVGPQLPPDQGGTVGPAMTVPVLDADQAAEATRKARREFEGLTDIATKTAAALGLKPAKNEIEDLQLDIQKLETLFAIAPERGAIALAAYMAKYDELVRKARELGQVPPPLPPALDQATPEALVVDRGSNVAVTQARVLVDAWQQAREALGQYNAEQETAAIFGERFMAKNEGLKASLAEGLRPALHAVAEAAIQAAASGESFTTGNREAAVALVDYIGKNLEATGALNDQGIAYALISDLTAIKTRLTREEAAAIDALIERLRAQQGATISTAQVINVLMQAQSTLGAIQGAVAASGSMNAEKQQRIQAQLARANAIINAALETARAVASFASYDYVGGALHVVAAAAFTYAAAVAGSGGGGGSSEASGGGSSHSAPNESGTVSHSPGRAQHGAVVPDVGPYGDRHPYELERGEAVIQREGAQKVLSGESVIAARAALPPALAAQATPVAPGLVSVPTPTQRPGVPVAVRHAQTGAIAGETDDPWSWRHAAEGVAVGSVPGVAKSRDLLDIGGKTSHQVIENKDLSSEYVRPIRASAGAVAGETSNTYGGGTSSETATAPPGTSYPGRSGEPIIAADVPPKVIVQPSPTVATYHAASGALVGAPEQRPAERPLEVAERATASVGAQTGHMVPDFGPYGDRHHYILERGESVIPRQNTAEVLAGRLAIMAPEARGAGLVPDTSRGIPIVGGRLFAAPLRPARGAENGAMEEPWAPAGVFGGAPRIGTMPGAFTAAAGLPGGALLPASGSNSYAVSIPAAERVTVREVQRNTVISGGGVTATLNASFHPKATMTGREVRDFLSQPEVEREFSLAVNRILER